MEKWKVSRDGALRVEMGDGPVNRRTVICSFGQNDPKAVERAEFIVEACNNYAALKAQRDELLAELKALLGFAEQYGPSERAGETDWSGYFESAHSMIDKTEMEIDS